MKTPVQDMILNFISQNPGCQIGNIIAGLPDLNRSSISSNLPKMVRQGKICRTTGRLRRYEYRVGKHKPAPIQLQAEKSEEIQPPAALGVMPKQQAISPEEWQRRFEKVQELESKGFHRRASRLSLELLDVTGDNRLREQLIIFKAGTNRLGIWL